ncbi:hypothetical protein ABG79_01053 [Caloramator mitchellensis]|uniref:Uncharacterized protein n=1 Tax=Caloramator mitchellensis TaxID=908809 RepID=A0A0R3K2U8_CALMK|nr:hypothetical protein [Caloramator mitchellensis]KRQ87250.1 hypothetical protein ABG79_01053 [Caloramator mitchellensis]
MKSKRLFNREVYFILFILMIILTPIILVGGKMFANRDFEYYLKNKDIDKLYSFIKYPSFSKKIFEEYFKYNFDGKIEIKEKKEMNNFAFLTVKTYSNEKIIILRKDDNKVYWDFNDYSTPFSITAPLNTKIFLEDMVYINTSGEVKIQNIPFGLYNLEAVLENCKTFSEKILSGQNLRINLELNDAAIENCKDIIRKYHEFYQKSINNYKIQDTEIIDKDRGIFNELIDEINWYKESNIKVKKNLNSFEIKNAYIDDNNQINIDTLETWDVEIKDEKRINKKNETYNKKYILLNPDYKIIQIITK